MKTIQRQTIIFFLPLGMEAFTNDQNPYSATKAGETYWEKRQMYINPESITIRDNKLVKSDLTKGGYVTQYWGEQLIGIEASGTTGSAGVEGINVLRNIYRHEQIQYRSVLADRQREQAAAALAAAKDAESELYSGAGGFLAATADLLTGGAFSSAVSGVSNAIDIITEPFGGGTEFGESFGGTGAFSTVPTLAAFATSIDMYFQGEFFRGYFKNFSVTETAQTPGHFSYQFSFEVTRRSGTRTNFMPWHRNPLDEDGETIMSQKTTVSKGTSPGTSILSFPTRRGEFFGPFSDQMPLDENNDVGVDGNVRSKFDDPLAPDVDSNIVTMPRSSLMSGGDGT